RVQGWTTLDPVTGAVNTNGQFGNITVPVGAVRPPLATTGLTTDLNLNSNAAADGTSAKTVPVSVVDSLGTTHVLTLNFQKTGANTWSYDVTIGGSEVSAGTAGAPFDTGASGTLTFDSDGRLTDPAAGTPISIEVAGL